MIINTQSIGLYRGDGLAIIKQTSKNNICKIKDKIARKLSEIGVDITISAGETSTNFLDVHLNLLTDDYNIKAIISGYNKKLLNQRVSCQT